MSAEKENQVIKKDENVPDFIREAQAMGDYKSFDRSEITIPMLMISQDGNPLCKRGHDEHIAGLEPGMWFNTTTHEVYGQSVDAIFVDSMSTHGVYSPAPESKFIREMQDSEFLRIEQYLQYDESKRGLVDITGRNLQPNEVVGERHKIFCVMPDRINSGMIIMYLKPGSFQAEKKWKDAMHYRGTPHHKSVWRLPLVLDSNDKGHSWYNFGKKRDTTATFVRYVSKIEFDLCEAIYREFNSIKESSITHSVPDDKY
jgi:hypothetical protein